MLCLRIGCFEEASLRCSGCGTAFYCSQKCGEHVWLKEKHFKVCGDVFMTDNDKLYKMDESFENFNDMMALLFSRSRQVAEISMKYAAELRDFEDHSIDREACQKWLDALKEAADGYDAWEAVSDKPRLKLENMSFWSQTSQKRKKKNLRKKVKKQVRAMTRESTRVFAQYFVDHLQYVPFYEFLEASRDVVRRAIAYAHGYGEMTSLQEVGKLKVPQLKSRLKARGKLTAGNKSVLVDRLWDAMQIRKKKRVVWLNYYAINRSMSYMMMLLFPEFQNDIDALCMSFAEVVSYVQNTDEEVLCLIVDDASYSGQQIALKVRMFQNDDVKFTSSAKSKIEFAITVPYLSLKAVAELRKYEDETPLQIFTTRASMMPREPSLGAVSEKMWSLQDFAKEEARTFKYRDPAFPKLTQLTVSIDELLGEYSSQDFNGKQPFLLSYGETDCPVVYFQHKLADRISVPNFLIAQAPYPLLLKQIEDEDKSKVIIENVPLFKNCKDAQFLYKVDPDEIVANDFIQTRENMCPFPPYKVLDFGLSEPATTSLLD